MSFTVGAVNRTAGRDLALVVTARSLGLLGDFLALLALTLRLHDDGAAPWEIAALMAAGTLPLVVVAPLAGQLVDRYDSRRLLVWFGAAQTVVCVGLAWAHGTAATLLLMAILGAAEAVTAATWQALVPRISGEEMIGRATGMVQAGGVVASLIGPALAGVLSGIAGTRLPLLIDAGTYAAVVVGALFVRTRRRPEPTTTNERTDDWRAGLRFLRSDQVLAPLVAGLTLFVLLGVMVNVIEVFLVRDTLGAGPAWFGGLVATWSVGVLVGSLAAARLRSQLGQVRSVQYSAALLSAALVGYAFAPGVGVLVPLALVGGIANGALNVSVSTVVMARTPEALRGRVSAATTAAVAAASALSLLAGGALAAVLTPRQIFAGAGIAGAVAAAATGPRAVRACRACATSVSPTPAASSTQPAA